MVRFQEIPFRAMLQNLVQFQIQERYTRSRDAASRELLLQKSRNLKCVPFGALYERVGNPNRTPSHGGAGGQNSNKYDFMTFATGAASIASHLSFLLNYLNCLYLLEFIAPPNGKLISRLLEHRDPSEFRVATSQASAQNQDRPGQMQSPAAITFAFQPGLGMLCDFKLFLLVQYPDANLMPMPPTYVEIRLAFCDFVDTYVMPTGSFRLRRTESLPSVAQSETSFRLTACNPFALKNLLEVVQNNQVWIPMRLHELIFLQLQFYPQREYQRRRAIDPRTLLPERLEFVQKNHGNQGELEQLLRQTKLKFWLPLQHIRCERGDGGSNGQGQAQAGNPDHARRMSFCVGFQCPKSGQVKLVRFYQEMQEQTGRGDRRPGPPTNFRPYFPSREKVLEHISFFSTRLGQLLYQDEAFNEDDNPLVRILRLAGHDIEELAHDPSFFKHPF